MSCTEMFNEGCGLVLAFGRPCYHFRPFSFLALIFTMLIVSFLSTLQTSLLYFLVVRKGGSSVICGHIQVIVPNHFSNYYATQIGSRKSQYPSCLHYLVLKSEVSERFQDTKISHRTVLSLVTLTGVWDSVSSV